MKATIGIYGTGPIGSGLATLMSGNQYQAIVIGHSENGMQQCRRTWEQNWDDLISTGCANQINKKAADHFLRITDDISALADCDIIFESVSENLLVKKNVYNTIEAVCRKDAIIASTTSSIDAEILADFMEKPERFVVAHPFQPSHILPLFEVVQHRRITEETVSAMCSFLDCLHREIVILRHSVPGFLVNRLAQALFRESIDLIEQDVVNAEDIDRAVKYAVGMRYASIGLLEYYDVVGFDLERAIAENIYPSLCCTKQIQRLTLDGLAHGETGMKAGKGIFDWSTKDPADFRLRAQKPYLDLVKKWDMPE